MGERLLGAAVDPANLLGHRHGRQWSRQQPHGLIQYRGQALGDLVRIAYTVYSLE